MNARPAERSDISRLQDLTQSKYDFGEYLELPNYRALVVEDGNLGVVGFSVMHIWRWNRSGQIAEVFIDPRHRNRGYGTLLIRELLDLARQEQLRILFDHVSPDEPGLHFYLRSGFTIVGYNSQFYDRPDPTRRTALYVARDVDLGEGSLTPE